jgi:hypothetical protein
MSRIQGKRNTGDDILLGLAPCSLVKVSFRDAYYHHHQGDKKSVYLNLIKFSRASSRVNWLKMDNTDVSRTISVLVLRETESLQFPWGRGRRWFSKRRFYPFLTNWRGWKPGRILLILVAVKALNLYLNLLQRDYISPCLRKLLLPYLPPWEPETSHDKH